MVSENKNVQDNEMVVVIDPELEDLIPGFINNRRKDVIKMQAALQDSDFEAIRILGHSMKGAGGGYGFDVITDIGRAIETAAAEKNTQMLNDQIHLLSHFIENVEVRYE